MNNGYCPICWVNPATSPHHITPRAEGGTDDKKNIVDLCKSCHDIVEEIYDSTGESYSPHLVATIRKLHDLHGVGQSGALSTSPRHDYYMKNRTSILARSKEWAIRNREHRNTYMREYNRRTGFRSWYDWLERNKERRAAYMRNRAVRRLVQENSVV